MIAPLLVWSLWGESFLCESRPAAGAEVLVVEGWIGYGGIRAAATAFQNGNYQFLITTGGMTNSRWSERQYSYAAMARNELIRQGVPGTRIIEASGTADANRRTFNAALAVQRVFLERQLRPPKAMDVVTFGPHARRSRMVFTKVFKPATKVGVISWAPPEFASERWWRSSERTKELFLESVAYWHELFWSSGR